MKFICDVHISYKIVTFLKKQGYEVVHVNEILDKWYTTDKAICEYADSNDFIVCSKDKDFRNSHFAQRSPKKLLLIALGNMKSKDVIDLLGANLTLLEEMSEKDAFLVEVTSDYIWLNRSNGVY